MTTRKKRRRPRRFPQFRLSIQEDKLYRLMARDYLHYLGNKRPKAEQLTAMQNLLCRVWVRRAVLFDPCLTKREKQCLYYAALGKKVKETAELIGVKVETVRTFREAIMAKLGCTSMIAAITAGIRYGL
jgi:DNA-binding CsgD family transcriptional regulator